MKTLLHDATRLAALLCSFAWLSAAQSAPLYAAQWLRDADYRMGGSGLNNSGQVVGTATSFAGPPVTSFDALWTGGLISTLPASADDINELGQIAGTVFTGGQFRAFIGDATSITPLGTLGGDSSHATSLNDAGQVVGYSTDASGDAQPFLYSGGPMINLGSLGGPLSSFAFDVNNLGQVVGYSSIVGGGGGPDWHAFLWSGGTMTDLGALGGRESAAHAINDHGQVVGYTRLPTLTMGFLYDGGTMTQLVAPGGASSYAYDINVGGQVVGVMENVPAGGSRAFVWEDGAMFDLNDVTTSGLDGVSLSGVFSINDGGQIVANGCVSRIDCRTFLLTPIGTVPEPASLTLLGAVLLAAGAAYRRKARQPR